MGLFLDDNLQHEAASVLVKAKALLVKFGTAADGIQEVAVWLVHAAKWALLHWEWFVVAGAMYVAAKIISWLADLIYKVRCIFAPAK